MESQNGEINAVFRFVTDGNGTAVSKTPEEEPSEIKPLECILNKNLNIKKKNKYNKTKKCDIHSIMKILDQRDKAELGQNLFEWNNCHIH